MEFLEALARLNVAKRGGRASPHKPVMMLAVLDMALAGALPENKIRLEPNLLERYRAFWQAVAEEGDHPNPHFPSFHLGSEPFWTLHAPPGGEAVLAATTRITSVAEARRKIDHASLEEGAWKLLQSSEVIERAADTLISRWFAEKAEALWKVWRERAESSRHERALREKAEDGVAEVQQPYLPARDAAFRRLVLEAYDYRCAASGWRFMHEDWFLVEAAHIVPFSESRNDDPRNGIALSPSYHRLMDRRLIAPGPDYKWHVSKMVDRRIPDNRELAAIDKTDLILPRDKGRWPLESYLQRRVATLL